MLYELIRLVYGQILTIFSGFAPSVISTSYKVTAKFDLLCPSQKMSIFSLDNKSGHFKSPGAKLFSHYASVKIQIEAIGTNGVILDWHIGAGGQNFICVGMQHNR